MSSKSTIALAVAIVLGTASNTLSAPKHPRQPTHQGRQAVAKRNAWGLSSVMTVHQTATSADLGARVTVGLSGPPGFMRALRNPGSRCEGHTADRGVAARRDDPLAGDRRPDRAPRTPRFTVTRWSPP